MEKEQVKSKKRVAEHGEVFTAEREVKAMCDLVKQETERIESRFLEPACGDGNFLAEILSRKLAVVKAWYRRSRFDYERYAVLAASSLYGIELLPDNVAECRERLFQLWDKEYSAVMKKDASDAAREAARYILSKNILCGDALTMKRADGAPILFAEWSLVTGSQLKRRDYEFEELVDGAEKKESLFEAGEKNDRGETVFIARPVREYPMTDYRRIAENG